MLIPAELIPVLQHAPLVIPLYVLARQSPQIIRAISAAILEHRKFNHKLKLDRAKLQNAIDARRGQKSLPAPSPDKRRPPSRGS